MCHYCGSIFEIEWKVIFEIQEMTHGYVGFEYGDYHVICPSCGEAVASDDPHLELEIKDGDLPF